MSNHDRLTRLASVAILFALWLFASLAMALEPDQIALVVNANVPEGRKLAELYAKGRNIPLTHIIELTLPAPDPDNPAEDISPADFDQKVAPAVRDFLTRNALDKQVRCLVTFWGIPLRIDRRNLTDAEKKEFEDIRTQIDQTRHQIEGQVQAAEDLAKEVDPAFTASTSADLLGLTHRAEAALNRIVPNLTSIADPPRRALIYDKMLSLYRGLAGEPALTQKLLDHDLLLVAPHKPTREELAAARKETAELEQQLNALKAEPSTAKTRDSLRDLFSAHAGSLNTLHLLVAQSNSLDTTESEAAFDSELALLWWPQYPKARWVPNPLYWKRAGREPSPGNTLMVMRLDGPSVENVRQMIQTSLTVEAAGLTGNVVLDARGKPANDPYGSYDQTIRNLNDLLKNHTKLNITFDDKEALIPRGSQHDIAIYCGWYSLRRYVSPGNFVPGAVGFHIASSEMISLHNRGETGWCRNLLEAGVVNTLGPVAEPYLQSFPPADEYFPLLMTGKVSLAEVYWETTPWVSWMQCCIGDPLYRPYKMNPALKVEDLPEGLRELVPESEEKP